uniref:UV radiation resistance-associated gene protein isoform X2 n=1 Tax=Myxine glutinosa TaxID=7769 RepID=UPI0035900719
MNVSDVGSIRAGHYELSSQQRRLRHLRTLSARNLVNRSGKGLLDTRFSLHTSSDNRVQSEFYTSEVIRDSLNPTWCSLDFGLLPERLDTSVSRLVVRVWACQGESFWLLLEWNVHLDGLSYIGPQIKADAPNSLIFGLTDGYYRAPAFGKPKSSTKNRQSQLQVEPSAVRTSYSVFSLLRLHTAQKAIRQTQLAVKKVHMRINERLKVEAGRTQVLKEQELLVLGVATLRSELDRQVRDLSRLTNALAASRASNAEREVVIEKHKSAFQQEHDGLRDKLKKLAEKRQQLQKINSQLLQRRRQIFSELSHIYPITVMKTQNQRETDDHFICQVRLPNSENFHAKEDSSIAVALGFTAHLVSMLALFLEVPLRYPLQQHGSRSRVQDLITDKLSDKEREFPLYSKGAERVHFEYGVYLLNKNVAQLRYCLGLNTTDLRQTLPNLRELFETRLGVSQSNLRTSPTGRQKASKVVTGPSNDVQNGEMVDKVTPSPGNRVTKKATIEWIRSDALPGAVSSPLTPHSQLEVRKHSSSLGSDVGPGRPGTEWTGKPGLPIPSSRIVKSVEVSGNATGASGTSAPPMLYIALDQPEEFGPVSMETGGATAFVGSDCGAAAVPWLCDAEAEVETAVEADSDEHVLLSLDHMDPAAMAQVHSELDEFSRRVDALSQNASSFRRNTRSDSS